MTYLEAAIKVLRNSRHPLTTSEITRRVLAQGLVSPTGRTPVATMSATLYRSLGKHPQLRREAELGRLRAKRGSVRWTLAPLN